MKVWAAVRYDYEEQEQILFRSRRLANRYVRRKNRYEDESQRTHAGKWRLYSRDHWVVEEWDVLDTLRGLELPSEAAIAELEELPDWCPPCGQLRGTAPNTQAQKCIAPEGHPENQHRWVEDPQRIFFMEPDPTKPPGWTRFGFKWAPGVMSTTVLETWTLPSADT